MAQMLRQFSYLDGPLVRDFLGQLEGGVFDEDTEVRRSGGKKSAGGRVGIASVGASAEARP